MTKKDYMAGMIEALTKMYDGKYQKRVLRKETIEIRDPVLIFFAGGIKSRITELLTPEHVASGFLPRFAIIAAESDPSLLRPLGPPTERSMGERQKIVDKFGKLHDHYAVDDTVSINGRSVTVPKKWEAQLTDAAWARYNDFETRMLHTGVDSNIADMLTPAFDRLSKTGLKLATLIAASRTLANKVIVDEPDIVRGFWYIEQWREYTIEILRNLGINSGERRLELILKAIRNKPGITRSQLMQWYHMTAKEADSVFTTLEQRGVIVRVRNGKTETLTPVG